MQFLEFTLKKKNADEAHNNYFQDMVIFPSKMYNLNLKGGKNKNLIECFIFSSNITKNFSNMAFSYIEPIIDNGAYVTINMEGNERLQEKREDLTLGNILANFIISIGFSPFFIYDKKIFIPVNTGIDVENENLKQFWNQKTIDGIGQNFDNFVDYNKKINPLLFFLDDFEWRSESWYQTEKFKNAVIALKLIILRGYPSKEIIDWDKNQIIDVDLRNKLIMEELDIDYQFIQGNLENRFCRLIRFALKIFIQNRDQLIEELTKFGDGYKNSALYVFTEIKPFIDNYIQSKQSSEEYNENKSKYYKKTKISEPYFNYLIVVMRNKQPSTDFTNIFLDRFSRKYASKTLCGGLKCKIEEVPTPAHDMQRYYIHLCFENGKSIPLSNLSALLTDVKLKMRSEIFDILKDINEKDFIQEMQKNGNSGFWLRYVEIIVPKIDKDVFAEYKKIFDYNFGFEQNYGHNVEKIFTPNIGKKVNVFELGFPTLFDISIDKYYYEHFSILDEADVFTSEAVNIALSGDLSKSEKVLFLASEILDADYEFLSKYKENKTRFKNHFEYEKWLKSKKLYPKVYENYDVFLDKEWTYLPYFDKKPILCHNIEEYEILKETNEHFIKSFHQFEVIKSYRNKFLLSKDYYYKYSILSKISNIFTNLGINKQKDLRYLESILKILKFKFF